MSRDYPRMMFHRTLSPVTVLSEAEEVALGAGWSRTIPQPESGNGAPQASRWEPEPEDEPEPEQPEEKPEEEEQPANEEAPARPKRAHSPLKRTPPGRRRKA